MALPIWFGESWMNAEKNKVLQIEHFTLMCIVSLFDFLVIAFTLGQCRCLPATTSHVCFNTP